ncbi:GD11585 [Drosophila simulans]|uniref:GD11585 n=1 Tax=Drosophila simulans TaxID=7240 RepID=B4QG15_DROSI|nr:GD11585 [Drosophila simulans]
MPKDGHSRKPQKRASIAEETPVSDSTTPATTASPSSPSRTAGHSTIGALVSNLHHHDIQSLHQPLLESEERVIVAVNHRNPRQPHRSYGTERKPHSSLPRFVINIEEETDAAVAAAEGKGSPAPHQEHEEHSNQSPSRRFSHFNLALRRFSHIHAHVNADYPG